MQTQSLDSLWKNSREIVPTIDKAGDLLPATVGAWEGSPNEFKIKMSWVFQIAGKWACG